MENVRNYIEPLLRTKNLTVGFNENSHSHALLKNLNLQLLAGRLVCFMGINGVGKSTLIRTLAGVQKPLKGSVEYSQEGEIATKVSVVLTDRITASHLTVYELVTFGRYPYLDWRIKLSENDLVIIDSAIDRVNIKHLIHKKLYQLSDGQLQMALIARALAQDAGIILLDEPTAHLDLNNRVEIMNLLKQLARDTNKAVLLATHELDLALQTADTIWLADHHHIVEGIPEDLVLNGCFDEIFKSKGFDLKTGRLHQTAYKNISVALKGEGYEFRWTKNALERCGFSIKETSSVKISIHSEGSTLEWQLIEGDKITTHNSLSALLNALS
jgi:iron complex transport system ATP-binding protein